MTAQGQFDASHGRLQVGTGVAGRAAKMGHRLTIAMERWQAVVSWSGEQPTAVTLTVEADSLRVLGGEGGMTPLTGPEKALIRTNARNCLGADKYRRIRFESSEIEATDDGYRLTGSLEIRGRTKPHVVAVQVSELGPPHQHRDSWRVDGETVVRHSDFGVRRYSMLMGAMQVADEVTVSFSATVSADEIRGS
ncbi:MULTISPECIES: YceI family protein [Mycobacteriaceae]|uniref:Polyisoprenoid-binding protein n=3 Tax=Mycobacteriaceae TaxID=1762 RepID=A0A7I9Y8F5_MYCAL|nr:MULTISPECIES: YceI family protein [Mycobacteriaceae]OQZ95802.1 S-adenosyl-L-methionine-dependent methyltransferase [Mycolicibacter algericus DSM 45454]BBX14997.1 polyisoprenoid-binding protein [Mycobacterium novum]GFG84961.1 polyisoprenoid-binding protein [Mycolicibacter algericus]